MIDIRSFVLYPFGIGVISGFIAGIIISVLFYMVLKLEGKIK